MISLYNRISKYIGDKLYPLIKKVNSFLFRNPLLILIFFAITIYYYIYKNDLFQACVYFGLFIIYLSLYLFFRKQFKDGDFSKLDNYERTIRLAGVLALMFLGITYITINIARFIIPDALHIGNIDSWIQFAGSILGGTLTLFALAITMNEQENVRKEDIKRRNLELAIISTPVLTFEVIDEFVRKPRHYKMMKTPGNLINFSLISDFYIKNTSNHFAILDNLKLDSIEIVNFFQEKNINIQTNDILKYTFDDGDIIPPNTSLTVEYDINCTIDNLNSIIFKLHLNYSDFMNINKYSIDAEFSLSVRIIDNESIENYFSDGEGIYVGEDEYYIEVYYSKFINKFKKI